MILTAELAAGTVTVDTTAGTWTLNGGDPRPIPAEWLQWVDDLAARATQAQEMEDLRAQLVAAQAPLKALLVAATAQVTQSADRATAAAATKTTLTTRQGTIADLPLASVTPTAIRDEISHLYGHLATIAQVIESMSTDDAQIVAGVVQATEVHLATVAVIDGMLS